MTMMLAFRLYSPLILRARETRLALEAPPQEKKLDITEEPSVHPLNVLSLSY